jgi:hypothetical protein
MTKQADSAFGSIELSFPRKSWESALCDACERNRSQTSASNVLSVQTLALGGGHREEIGALERDFQTIEFQWGKDRLNARQLYAIGRVSDDYSIAENYLRRTGQIETHVEIHQKLLDADQRITRASSQKDPTQLRWIGIVLRATGNK